MKAEIIAKVLRGRRAGGPSMACCPGHDVREPSLAITTARNGKVLVHCHEGYDQQNVIAALRWRGLWHEGQYSAAFFLRELDGDPSPELDGEALKRTERRPQLDLTRPSGQPAQY